MSGCRCHQIKSNQIKSIQIKSNQINQSSNQSTKQSINKCNSNQSNQLIKSFNQSIKQSNQSINKFIMSSARGFMIKISCGVLQNFPRKHNEEFKRKWRWSWRSWQALLCKKQFAEDGLGSSRGARAQCFTSFRCE